VGLLTNYAHHLHPSLFDTTVYEQLEAELGAEQYRLALEQGNVLTLDDVVSEVLRLLDDPSEGLALKGYVS
jgi:hypothetical protein